MQSSSSPQSRGQTKKGLFVFITSVPLRLGGTARLEIIFPNFDGMSLLKLQHPGLPLTASIRVRPHTIMSLAYLNLFVKRQKVLVVGPFGLVVLGSNRSHYRPPFHPCRPIAGRCHHRCTTQKMVATFLYPLRHRIGGPGLFWR